MKPTGIHHAARREFITLLCATVSPFPASAIRLDSGRGLRVPDLDAQGAQLGAGQSHQVEAGVTNDNEAGGAPYLFGPVVPENNPSSTSGHISMAQPATAVITGDT